MSISTRNPEKPPPQQQLWQHFFKPHPNSRQTFHSEELFNIKNLNNGEHSDYYAEYNEYYYSDVDINLNCEFSEIS